MKNTPRIYDVKFAQRPDIGFIENRPALNVPVRGIRRISSLHFLRAGNGLRIIVKRIDTRSTQADCSERMDAATASYVEKCLTAHVSQHFGQPCRGFSDAALVDDRKEIGPVLTKGKTDFGIRTILQAHECI